MKGQKVEPRWRAPPRQRAAPGGRVETGIITGNLVVEFIQQGLEGGVQRVECGWESPVVERNDEWSSPVLALLSVLAKQSRSSGPVLREPWRAAGYMASCCSMRPACNTTGNHISTTTHLRVHPRSQARPVVRGQQRVQVPHQAHAAGSLWGSSSDGPITRESAVPHVSWLSRMRAATWANNLLLYEHTLYRIPALTCIGSEG